MTNEPDLLGTIEISDPIRGGLEPKATVTLRVDLAGFHDATSVGGSGQEVGVVEVERVAAQLIEQFDPAAVRALLSHFVRLHDAIAR